MTARGAALASLQVALECRLGAAARSGSGALARPPSCPAPPAPAAVAGCQRRHLAHLLWPGLGRDFPPAPHRLLIRPHVPEHAVRGEGKLCLQNEERASASLARACAGSGHVIEQGWRVSLMVVMCARPARHLLLLPACTRCLCSGSWDDATRSECGWECAMSW